jgi:hypothetical protein
MKLICFSLIFSQFLILLGCGPTQQDLNSEKRAEVMAIHDEVMPKLGQLKSFEKKAAQRAAVLAAKEPIDTLQIKQLEVLAKDLDQAYEGMFVWMRQYKLDEEGKSPEEIKLYLDSQLTLVTKVNIAIKDALAKSDSLLTD